MEYPRIIQLHVSFTGPVIIKGENQYILVDTGPEKKMNELLDQFRMHNVDPGKIKLIVLTHTHYDHTGNLPELKELTGAKVVVNRREAEWLRTGQMPIPRGTNIFSRMIVGLGDFLMPGYASPRPFEADIFVDDELDLSPWGVEGKIIHTPGHTEGSQSVIIGSHGITGDCFFNIKGIVFPPFANNPAQLLETWQKLFDMGIETIYPGHGRFFNVEKAKEVFYKKTRNRKIKDINMLS